jgi:hypothetical protein
MSITQSRQDEIDEILVEIGLLWKKNHYQRFLQLMVNTIGSKNAEDPFYIRDETFLKLIEKANEQN